MVLIPNNEQFLPSSGLINIPFLEGLYHSVMDEAFGIARTIILHLQPIVEQDVTTQSKPAPQQLNPFFGRVPVPQANTRNTGTKITPRDVAYKAQIKVGPLASNDETGMGHLLDNQVMCTLVIEALSHVNQALSVSIEGRRYRIEESRPIGFSTRRYLMVKMTEIQETENPSSDVTIG